MSDTDALIDYIKSLTPAQVDKAIAALPALKRALAERCPTRKAVAGAANTDNGRAGSELQTLIPCSYDTRISGRIQA
ncbi:MAG: hypothetical protein IJO39_01780 [Clostridia bacterium]|nr:hypothetical protein [Clostridia bacterium]